MATASDDGTSPHNTGCLLNESLHNVHVFTCKEGRFIEAPTFSPLPGGRINVMSPTKEMNAVGKIRFITKYELRRDIWKSYSDFITWIYIRKNQTNLLLKCSCSHVSNDAVHVTRIYRDSYLNGEDDSIESVGTAVVQGSVEYGRHSYQCPFVVATIRAVKQNICECHIEFQKHVNHSTLL